MPSSDPFTLVRDSDLRCLVATRHRRRDRHAPQDPSHLTRPFHRTTNRARNAHSRTPSGLVNDRLGNDERRSAGRGPPADMKQPPEAAPTEFPPRKPAAISPPVRIDPRLRAGEGPPTCSVTLDDTLASASLRADFLQKHASVLVMDSCPPRSSKPNTAPVTGGGPRRRSLRARIRSTRSSPIVRLRRPACARRGQSSPTSHLIAPPLARLATTKRLKGHDDAVIAAAPHLNQSGRPRHGPHRNFRAACDYKAHPLVDHADR